ncbi:hypothetical protein KM043_010182 [Ampulex compressa]|nr:hypothetical protein KM043_010182 [Ampulex compressa]
MRSSEDPSAADNAPGATRSENRRRHGERSFQSPDESSRAGDGEDERVIVRSSVKTRIRSTAGKARWLADRITRSPSKGRADEGSASRAENSASLEEKAADVFITEERRAWKDALIGGE